MYVRSLAPAAAVLVHWLTLAASSCYAADNVFDAANYQQSCRRIVYGGVMDGGGWGNGPNFTDGECLGFSTAATQAIFLYQKVFDRAVVCFPPGNTNGQSVKVWLNYLDSHPEELHLPAFITYLEAIEAAFPCRTDKNASLNTAPSLARSNDDAAARFGTGFFVSADGTLLTNAHVVKECTHYNVREKNGNWEPANFIALSSKSDLGLLQVRSQRAFATAHFRRGTLGLGESILIFGYPLPGLLASSGNVTIGNVTALAGLHDDGTLLQLSAPVQPGNSGGPVVDQSGDVVGVVVGKLNVARVASIIDDIPQNVNFAIKSSVVTDFLDLHAVKYDTGNSSGRGLSSTEQAAAVQKFTVQISCTGS